MLFFWLSELASQPYSAILIYKVPKLCKPRPNKLQNFSVSMMSSCFFASFADKTLRISIFSILECRNIVLMLQDACAKGLKIKFEKQKGRCPALCSIVIMSFNRSVYDLSRVLLDGWAQNNLTASLRVALVDHSLRQFCLPWETCLDLEAGRAVSICEGQGALLLPSKTRYGIRWLVGVSGYDLLENSLLIKQGLL